jgi:hypothetical protein
MTNCVTIPSYDIFEIPANDWPEVSLKIASDSLESGQQAQWEAAPIAPQIWEEELGGANRNKNSLLRWMVGVSHPR